MAFWHDSCTVTYSSGHTGPPKASAEGAGPAGRYLLSNVILSETAGKMPVLAVPSETAAPGPPEVRPAPRLHFIDGLRGLAMLMVLACHCWIFGGLWTLTLPLGNHPFNVASLLAYGSTGVNLFLVLSGFCLYWPFVKGAARREPTLWEFAKKRCRRILPPYYVTLLLYGAPLFFLAIHHHSRPEVGFAWNWLWLHVVMAHNLNLDYVIRVDGALWTLALEFQLYILFPLFVEAFRRFNARGVLLAVLVASTCYHVLVWKAQIAPLGYVPHYGEGFVLNSSVFGRCFEFVLGMYCALLVARWHKEQKSPLSWPDYLLFALILPMGWLDQGSHIVYDAMWGLLYAALLLMASRPRSMVHQVLSHRVLVSLGLFSYSVYLIHQPLVIALGHFAIRHFSNAEVVGFELCIVIPLMLGLGYGFHLLFERPFMNAPRDRDPSTRPSRFRFLRLAPGKDPAGPAPLVVSAVSDAAASPSALVSQPIPPIM